MTTLVGADPAALSSLSDAVRTNAIHLRLMQTEINGTVEMLAWRGNSADEYLTLWRTAHSGDLQRSVVFLEQAAETLQRNATEQQSASDSSFGIAAGSPESFLAQLTQRSNSSRFGLEALEQSQLHQLGPGELQDWVLRHQSAFRVAGTLAQGESLLIDFLKDANQNAHLPTDERIVHAISESAMRYAIESGISQALQWTGTAVAGLLTAGVGLLVGRAVGWLLGEVLGAGFRYLDDTHQLTDQGADLMTDAYRAVRDNPTDYLPAAPIAAPYLDGMSDSWDAATDVFPALEDWRDGALDTASGALETGANTLGYLLDEGASAIAEDKTAAAGSW